VTDTTIANKTLVIESTGLIAGSITYEDLEIKKGGSLQGSINKVGQQPQNFAPPSPPAAVMPEPVPEAPPAAAPAQVKAAPPTNDMTRKPRI
jgi:cytoskeletal protein CcmA (bactofilin family)